MPLEILLPVIGSVLGALLVFLGAWNTSKVAKLSNERTNALESFKLQLDARDKLNEDLRDDLDKMEAKLDKLTERFDQVQQNERMLFWWAKSVHPILVASGIPFPTPPPGVAS